MSYRLRRISIAAPIDSAAWSSGRHAAISIGSVIPVVLKMESANGASRTTIRVAASAAAASSPKVTRSSRWKRPQSSCSA